MRSRLNLTFFFFPIKATILLEKHADTERPARLIPNRTAPSISAHIITLSKLPLHYDSCFDWAQRRSLHYPPQLYVASPFQSCWTRGNAQDVFRRRAFYASSFASCTYRAKQIFSFFFLFCFLGGVGAAAAAAINLMKFRQSFSLLYFRLRWWINWCVWGDDALPSRGFCHEDCAATLPDGFWWRRCAWKCEMQTVFTSLPNSWTLDVKIIADLYMKLEFFYLFFSKAMLSRNDHRRRYTQTKKTLVNSFFFHLFCLIPCRPWCGLIRSLHDWDSSGKCQPTLAWPNAKTQCLHRSYQSPYTWNYNIFLALK